jgi:hypothetical protein
MKKRLSNVFISMMVIGIMSAGAAIQLAVLNCSSACAVMSTFGFIFLWAPFMLPDEEKYTVKRER